MVQVDVCDGSRLREFLTTEEFKESVRAQFEELDTDHTGGLSKAQLKTALFGMMDELGLPPQEEVDDLEHSAFANFFQACDEDGSGAIELNEFTDMLTALLGAMADSLESEPIIIPLADGEILRSLLEDEEKADALLSQCFEDHDVDGKGQLSRDQVRSSIISLRREFGLPAFQRKEEAVAMFDDVFKTVDIEEDGKLDKAEYIMLIKSLVVDLADKLRANPIPMW